MSWANGPRRHSQWKAHWFVRVPAHAFKRCMTGRWLDGFFNPNAKKALQSSPFREKTPPQTEHAMKHTPGPWKVLSDPCHFGTLSSIIGGKDNGRKRHPLWELMAEVGGNADWRKQEANTRLMAAAPDLLDIVERCERWLSTVLDGREMQLICQAAIAKATGEQP